MTSFTPPQAGPCKSMRPSLEMRCKKEGVANGFVRRSAICAVEEIGKSLINPSSIFSRIRWQSISMCLVRSWKIGL